MISGNFLPSEIWVNLLTPERAAAIERSYQEQRREQRRRIDAKFTTNQFTGEPERRSQVTAPTKPSLAEFEKRCDRLIRAMERLAAARDRRRRMMREIIDL
jgi:hypothetical protein